MVGLTLLASNPFTAGKTQLAEPMRRRKLLLIAVVYMIGSLQD